MRHGNSHTSGIYRSVALVKKFALMMGTFFSIPAPIMCMFWKFLPQLGV